MKKFKIEFRPSHFPEGMNCILRFKASGALGALALCYEFIRDNLPDDPDTFHYEIDEVPEDDDHEINFSEVA